MIVQVTGNKYNVGCGKGYGINIPNLEFKLNCILDPDRSTWPEPVDNRSQEEIDAGVPGPSEIDKELHEGDIFILDGTVFAIDHDRLVQVVSETGPLAFQRIFDSIISPEIDFMCLEDEDNTYSWDDDLLELPEDLIEFTPKYEWMRIWHENFWEGRNLRQEPIIRVGITDKILKETRYFYLTKWKLYYSSSEFDENEVQYYLRHIMCYFYSEVGRVKPKI